VSTTEEEIERRVGGNSPRCADGAEGVTPREGVGEVDAGWRRLAAAQRDLGRRE